MNKPLVWLITLLLTACSADASSYPNQTVQTKQGTTLFVDILGTAEAEATAMLEVAKATAIIREAQTAAIGILQESQARWLGEEPIMTLSTADALREERLPTPQPFVQPTIVGTPLAGNESTSVQIIKVEIGGEGGFIVVNYTSSYQEAQNFWPSRIWLEDEETRIIYDEIPVMPIIGPLIARPQQDGQPGYIMFVNNPPLFPGAVVTLVFDTYEIKHIPVR